MESIQQGRKNNLYRGYFNNDNKNIPSRKNDNSGLRKDGIYNSIFNLRKAYKCSKVFLQNTF